MKLNKLEGIKFLQKFNFPTPEILDTSEVLNGNIPLKNGVSVRLSPKMSSNDRNVLLPSLHGCTDIDEIQTFIQSNSRFNSFIHYTVSPEVIGSVSKLNYAHCVSLETYKSFENRSHGIIDNQVTIPFEFDKLWISKLVMLRNDPDDFRNFRKVIIYLKDIPFSQYDIEYVIQNGSVLFTDLTLPDNREYNSFRSFLLNSNGDER